LLVKAIAYDNSVVKYGYQKNDVNEGGNEMSQNENVDSILISSSNRNDSGVLEKLGSYLNNHIKIGCLIFQVYEESPLNGVVPVANSKVTISKKLEDSYFVSKVLETNKDGKTEPLDLPTVSAKRSITPQEGEMFATYSASVSAENFLKKTIADIHIFEGITSIQPVNLVSNIDYNTIKYKNEKSEKNEKSGSIEMK